MDKIEVVPHAFLSKDRDIHSKVELDKVAIARMMGLPENLTISAMAADIGVLKLYVYPKERIETGEDFKVYGDSLVLLENRLAHFNDQ